MTLALAYITATVTAVLIAVAPVFADVAAITTEVTFIGAQIATLLVGSDQITVVPVLTQRAPVLVAVAPISVGIAPAVANSAIVVADVTMIPPDIVAHGVAKRGAAWASGKAEKARTVPSARIAGLSVVVSLGGGFWVSLSWNRWLYTDITPDRRAN